MKRCGLVRRRLLDIFYQIFRDCAIGITFKVILNNMPEAEHVTRAAELPGSTFGQDQILPQIED